MTTFLDFSDVTAACEDKKRDPGSQDPNFITVCLGGGSLGQRLAIPVLSNPSGWTGMDLGEAYAKRQTFLYQKQKLAVFSRPGEAYPQGE